MNRTNYFGCFGVKQHVQKHKPKDRGTIITEAPVNLHNVRERAWVSTGYVWRLEPVLSYFTRSGDSIQKISGLWL